VLWNETRDGNSVSAMTPVPASSNTEIVVRGPYRKPAQMLANQTYSGHKSVHDDESAAKLGLAGAPIEGPTHFSQFEPLAAALWGDRWFSHGCISAHFQNMVIEGEEVQAQVTLSSLGATTARIDAIKADATPVLTGTASIGPDHGESELSARLAIAKSRDVGRLHVIDQLTVGLRGPIDDMGTLEFDTNLGNLYPFTLREKLASITEQVSYHADGAETPWGGPVVPLEMLSVLVSSFSTKTGMVVRQPSVGLFIDLEVKLVNGPVLVGQPYRVEWEIVALGSSRKTESYWTRFTLIDKQTTIAEVLLHQGVFTASYPDYPGNES
jgi:acyl dehydratase